MNPFNQMQQAGVVGGTAQGQYHYNTPVDAQRPTPQIEMGINGTNSRVENLARLLDALEARLGPVLAPMSPSGQTNSVANTPPTSPMAQVFLGLSTRIGQMEEQADRLLQRLEL